MLSLLVSPNRGVPIIVPFCINETRKMHLSFAADPWRNIFRAVYKTRFKSADCRRAQRTFRFVQYPHKVWKHGECFRASNTAAYGPKCLPFLRNNSRLSYRKANLKKNPVVEEKMTFHHGFL
jgi:hypothetical protein